MAASSFDPQDGHPIFADGDAPDVARNPTEVAEYAAKVGNRLIGTTAQREAYQYGREGVSWYDTTANRLYTHNGTAFIGEKLRQSGTHTITNVSGGGSDSGIFWTGQQTVTFPVPYSTPPNITATAIGTYVGFAHVSTRTATSFTYRLARVGSPPIAQSEVMWSAEEA